MKKIEEKELEKYFNKVEEYYIYYFYTKQAFSLWMRYGKWYYRHFGHKIQKNKSHCTQYILNPVVKFFVLCLDSFLIIRQKK